MFLLFLPSTACLKFQRLFNPENIKNRKNHQKEVVSRDRKIQVMPDDAKNRNNTNKYGRYQNHSFKN